MSVILFCRVGDEAGDALASGTGRGVEAGDTGDLDDERRVDAVLEGQDVARLEIGEPRRRDDDLVEADPDLEGGALQALPSGASDFVGSTRRGRAVFVR